jgi:hypothetical protein
MNSWQAVKIESFLPRVIREFKNCQTIRIAEVGSGHALGAQFAPKEVFQKPPISFDGRLAHTALVVLSALCRVGEAKGKALTTLDVLVSHNPAATPSYLSPELNEEWMPLDGIGGVDGLNLGELGRLGRGIEWRHPILSSLCCLKLRLGGYWKGKTPREFTELAQILETTRSLQRLDLRFDISASPLFRPVLKVDPPSALSEVRISGLHTTTSLLKAFL